MTQDDSRISQNEGERHYFLVDFILAKLLAFPVLGHKKGPSYTDCLIRKESSAKYLFLNFPAFRGGFFILVQHPTLTASLIPIVSQFTFPFRLIFRRDYAGPVGGRDWQHPPHLCQ